MACTEQERARSFWRSWAGKGDQGHGVFLVPFPYRSVLDPKLIRARVIFSAWLLVSQALNLTSAIERPASLLADSNRNSIS